MIKSPVLHLLRTDLTVIYLELVGQRRARTTIAVKPTDESFLYYSKLRGMCSHSLSQYYR
jgi:hypothetical protein